LAIKRRGGRRRISADPTPPETRYLIIDNSFGVDHVVNGELYNLKEVEAALADTIDEDNDPDDFEVYQVGPRINWYRETKVQIEAVVLVPKVKGGKKK